LAIPPTTLFNATFAGATNPTREAVSLITPSSDTEIEMLKQEVAELKIQLAAEKLRHHEPPTCGSSGNFESSKMLLAHNLTN
jgi:hypothetical protein